MPVPSWHVYILSYFCGGLLAGDWAYVMVNYAGGARFGWVNIDTVGLDVNIDTVPVITSDDVNPILFDQNSEYNPFGVI
jgi:hypothetical protein